MQHFILYAKIKDQMSVVKNFLQFNSVNTDEKFAAVSASKRVQHYGLASFTCILGLYQIGIESIRSNTNSCTNYSAKYEELNE